MLVQIETLYNSALVCTELGNFRSEKKLAFISSSVMILEQNKMSDYIEKKGPLSTVNFEGSIIENMQGVFL